MRPLLLILALGLWVMGAAPTWGIRGIFAAGPGCANETIEEALAGLALTNADEWEIRLVGFSSFSGTQVEHDADADLTIRGGFETCDSSEPTLGGSVIEADGVLGGIFRFHRSPDSAEFTNVRLIDVSIQEGDATTGGAIAVSGKVRLELIRSGLRFNRAVVGGALHLDGTHGASVRFIDSLAVGNHAHSGRGGALFCAGGTVFLEGDSDIFGNLALGSGGGLAASGCTIEVAGPTTLVSNRANGGGAVSLELGSTLKVRATSEGRPLFARNINEKRDGLAALPGGAVLAVGASLVDVEDAIFDENRSEPASGGGAVLGLSGAGTIARIGSSPDCGDSCTLIADHHAPVASVADVSDGATLLVRRAVLTGNRVFEDDSGDGEALFWVRDGGNADLVSVLMVGNRDHKALVEVFGDASASVLYSTATDNDLSSATLRVREGSDGSMGELEIEGSILHHPGFTVFGNHPGATTRSRCLVTNDDRGVVGEAIVEADDPGFVAAAAGDYSLSADSVALDLCDGTSAPPIDLAGATRGRDQPDVTDRLGPFDAGAFERPAPSPPPTAPLFEDGFESGDLSKWSSVRGAELR